MINSNAPYYDRFKEENRYTKILFKPGVVLQNSELNEMQSIQKNNIKNIADTILTNGDIIEGCQLVISSIPDSVQKKCTVTEGRIYLNGDVHSIDESTILINGVGTEKIGVILTEEIVDSLKDASLKDPASGYDNYLQSGSDRLKESLKLVLNDETASTLFLIEDGEAINAIKTDSTAVLVERVNNTLARRTFDESGNYRVSGLELSAKNISDKDNTYVNLSEGKAYVRGYEIIKQTATNIPIKRATDVRRVLGEQKVFITGRDKYKLNNSPVQQVNALIATIKVTTNLTRQGSVNGRDPVPEQYTPVVEILSITQEASGVTYTKDIDYTLDGNDIRWLEKGREPDLGASYTVTLTYNKTMVKDTDYKVILQGTDYYIQILNASGDSESGDTPVNSTNLLIDYSFMLYRRDVLFMDNLGEIHITYGQPDTIDDVESPTVENPDVLILGSVLSQPKNDTLSIINTDNTRLSMDDLHRLASRVYDLEYNQAVNNLDKEAMEGEQASNLKGILTDNFVGFTKSDVNHSLYTASIDLDAQELTLSATDSIFNLSPVSYTTVVPVESYTKYNRLLTAKAVQKPVISQLNATGVMLINAYSVFPATPLVNLSPSIDNWIEESKITVEGATVVSTVTLRKWWRHKGESWTSSEKAQWEALGFTDSANTVPYYGTATVSTTNTHSVVSKILDDAITYMRQKVINVVGEKFPPYTDNLVVTFDGIKVSATPASDAYKGSQSGTLKADASGSCRGTFTIPANTMCGTKSVQIYPYSKPNILGATTYTANGRKRVVETTVWKEIVKATAVDPIAQTFSFNVDRFVTGVDLYFKAKDANKPLTVQLRGTSNGYPSTICYAEKVIYPDNISISDDASKATRVQFDDPVFCRADTQYCVTVLTESNVASLFYAELGGKDINTGTQLIKNPYEAGNMFSSSNATTWIAHMGSNIKFSLYSTEYDDVGYVYLTEVKSSGNSFDRIMLIADTSVPTGTQINWEYSLDSGTSWKPLTPYADNELEELATSIIVRAKLVATRVISPVIALESLQLVAFVNRTSCDYISRNVQLDDKYTTVKQVVDVFTPSGTGVVLYYATDTVGTSWKTAPQDSNTPVKVLDSSGWQRITYVDTISSGAKNYRIRVSLTTNNRLVRPRVKNLMSILK